MGERVRVEEAKGSAERLEALALEFLVRAQTAERDASDARAEIKRIRKVAGQHIEENSAVCKQRDGALLLLSDALFQLRDAGETEFRFGSSMTAEVKLWFMRALQELTVKKG